MGSYVLNMLEVNCAIFGIIEAVIRVDYRTWRHKLIQEAAKQRIPLKWEFELTARCNLACEMCYVKDTASNKEKTSQEWEVTEKVYGKS